ncbi:MAG: helix-turn-helix transcriptional regulator [Clostridia bacterium]|nr:helix-turn-helix transcriptional regulator [Clostridia bacterium]
MNLEFGKNLKKLRRERDMTQDELAQALNLSVQAISRYETGAAYPDIEMLPVIAGYFGTTVDALLGVSSEMREKRKDEYLTQLRLLTDRRDRLALLRRQRAEFPEAWDVVSDMMNEMTYLPECADEMRQIAEDAMRHCDEPVWRENILLFYLKSEPDDGRALTFIEKWSSRYDVRKTANLRYRYMCRGDRDRLRRISQKILRDNLISSLLSLTERSGTAEHAIADCRQVLDFIGGLSGNRDPVLPDMWTDARLRCMLSLSDHLFACGNGEEGFGVLESAVCLLENFFALPNRTVLTYGTEKLDCLSAKTGREVYYRITEFTGMIAESMMMNLVYETPAGDADTAGNTVRDMEGFERDMVFARHTYDLLRTASRDGFARVKSDQRYRALLERVKAVTSLENNSNLLYLMRAAAARDDEWIRGKNWVCALLVKDTGAYIVFDDDGDIRDKFARMKRENNTAVMRIAAAEVGGWLIPPPDVIVRNLIALDPDNADAEVLLDDGRGGTLTGRLSGN